MVTVGSMLAVPLAHMQAQLLSRLREACLHWWTDLFQKKEQEFKCSASEGLAFYPVMQSFLQRRLPGIASRECREAIQSFFLLCDVLDALQLSATGRVNADDLEEKICRHMRKYVEVYGPEKVLPKGHYALHLADSLRHHEILLSCFVHERRHRSVRQIADQLDSMKAGSEEHVMQVAVENHLNDLRAYTVGRKGLVTPRSAAAVLQEAFCHCFGLDECVGLESCNEAAVGQGRICKRGDVVVVAIDGTLTVAQVWLHVSFCGHGYTCLSSWMNLGNITCLEWTAAGQSLCLPRTYLLFAFTALKATMPWSFL